MCYVGGGALVRQRALKAGPIATMVAVHRIRRREEARRCMGHDILAKARLHPIELSA
jgi:hypothetical protein